MAKLKRRTVNDKQLGKVTTIPFNELKSELKSDFTSGLQRLIGLESCIDDINGLTTCLLQNNANKEKRKADAAARAGASAA